MRLIVTEKNNSAKKIAEILSGTTDLPVVFTRRCRRLADALGLLSPRAR